MGQFVLVQVTRLRESLITLQTSVELHPGMRSFVYFKFLRCCEIVATLPAGEVHTERRLGTDWGTGERLLKGRGSFMLDIAGE